MDEFSDELFCGEKQKTYYYYLFNSLLDDATIAQTLTHTKTQTIHVYQRQCVTSCYPSLLPQHAHTHTPKNANSFCQIDPHLPGPDPSTLVLQCRSVKLPCPVVQLYQSDPVEWDG